MNSKLKDAFIRIKPVCDLVMICPTADSIAGFMCKIRELKNEVLQELQQYVLFPFITHMKAPEMRKNYELHSIIIDTMKDILERVTVNSFEMFLKIEIGLLNLVFDNAKPGMVAEVPEELKFSVMKCLTVLVLNLDKSFREKFLKDHVPLIAQGIFVSVHIAKLEKMRSLRLAAMENVMAHTFTHKKFTNDNYQITDTKLEALVVDMLASILPGVLAALQDVAMCKNNPGHAVIVAAIEAIHRILCITMNDKYLKTQDNITAEDFAKMVLEKTKIQENEVSSKGDNSKNLTKRSPEWFKMAGEKLTAITTSVVALRTYEHYKVRMELAVYCYRVLFECNRSMQPSIPIVLDVLISLSKDEYEDVCSYSSNAVTTYLKSKSDSKHKTLDGLCDNFFTTLISLPRILNNIDAARKLSALNQVHGYIQVLSDSSRPQRLTVALSAHNNMETLCNALLEAAVIEYDLVLLNQQESRDINAEPPSKPSWSKLRLADEQCERRLREVCQLLSAAECGELILDKLLDMLQSNRDPALLYIINQIGSAPKSSKSIARRILNTYIEEDLWYLPLEVGSGETPIRNDETLDVSVYNPRAWSKDSVPGLYEGATETRYTGISYDTPRLMYKDPNYCSTLSEAQRNIVVCCLLCEGVAIMSTTLAVDFQPYLLKTLCLVLERVGSKYSMLHLAGVKAINEIAIACGHTSVAELIRSNADYFTNQVTSRLKKAWDSQSALQILSVVMEYSDVSIMDCLYGIVQDVLVQSCDKYYERDLSAYLKVFLTFINCINKWFPSETEDKTSQETERDENLLDDVLDFLKNNEEAERLLDNDEFEKECGKSVEDMYKEDLKEKEDNILDYDDRVTEETQPPPQHIIVTISVLKRCINFIPSKHKEEAILSLQVLTQGFPILQKYENELLPLVHASWAPLVSRFRSSVDKSRFPVVLKYALQLLMVLADLSKDFITSRTVKEVLPHMLSYLKKSAQDSYLKDAGSAYRNSQAYEFQLRTLTALPKLVQDLGLEDKTLEESMECVDPYLSNKQPKPLQASAVSFYQALLVYDYGATWHHLKVLCDNNEVLEPPSNKAITLEAIVGTPFSPRNKDYASNIKIIFNVTER